MCGSGFIREEVATFTISVTGKPVFANEFALIKHDATI